jgi:hypothetical protein
MIRHSWGIEKGIGMRVRRVVTGHDRDGKAVFASDQEVDPLTVALLPGWDLHRLWGADQAPTFPGDGSPTAQPSYFPPVGGYRFGLSHRRHRHQSSSARELLRRGPAEFYLMDKAVERYPGYAHAERKHAERDRRDRRHLPRSQGGTRGMPHSSADRTGMSKP